MDRGGGGQERAGVPPPQGSPTPCQSACGLEDALAVPGSWVFDALVLDHPVKRQGQAPVMAMAADACPVLLTGLPLVSLAPHSNTIVIPT